MTVEVSFNFPDYDLKSLKMLQDLPLLIAATVQTQRGMIFKNEGQYNGRPKWEPLKFRKGQILKDTGTLSKSIGPKNNGKRPVLANGSIVEIQPDMVTVGTDIAYAIVHEEGRTIYSKNGPLLHFQVPEYVKVKGKLKQSGTRWIHAHKVTIPARPFGDFTQQDADELAATIHNYYMSFL